MDLRYYYQYCSQISLYSGEDSTLHPHVCVGKTVAESSYSLSVRAETRVLIVAEV